MAFKILKKLKWFLIIPLAVIAFFVIMGIRYSGPLTEKELSEKFIVVNPLDLSQIRGLSKYRSCAGHDYRGPTVQTSRKESTSRSMKHYIKVKEELRGKNGVIKAIAPFDGKISNIEKRDPESKPYDQQIWLTPDTNSKIPRQWNFIFFHIDLNDGLKEGAKVKAGEIIGTAYMTRGRENSTDNFDMAVKFTKPMSPPAIDFPLAHASDEVLAEYENYGVTLSGLEVLEEYRDQNPCPVSFPATSDFNDYAYFKEVK